MDREARAALTLEFEPSLTLPALSWCARVRPRGPIQVRHGAGIETRREGLVEGAWDGSFEAFDFDLAKCLAGTGVRLRDGRVTFSSPFHPLERLLLVRKDEEVLVSNSLVFLLTEAGDSLDLAYPNYFFDLVAQVRGGIASPPARLRTASGNFVELYFCCNLEILPDLKVVRTPKALAPEPSCYAAYFEMLRTATSDIAANAMSPYRRQTYRLVAACSRGYDSTATAALAALAGCGEGVTYSRSASVASGHPLFGSTEVVVTDDCGSDSLRALGMSALEYDRADLVKLAGHPRAEFYISPASITDANTRLMENTVRNSVFISGRHGERYWGPTRRCARKNLREIDDCLLSGQSLGEFRLRVGFVHFPPVYVGAVHAPAIFRITHSSEMRPWKLGTGYYDRPIARRIAEEAGVPRENFGHKKIGAGYLMRELSGESEADFRNFLESNVPAGILRRLDPRPLGERLPRHRRLAYFRTQYSHWPLVSATMDLLGSDREHMLWNSIYLYQFHWGFDKMRSRYR